MKIRFLSYAAPVSVLLAIIVPGCTGDDPVGPNSQPATFENAVFGTFKDILVSYSRTGVNGTFKGIVLDSTSYLRIERSDSSYSMKLHGVVQDTQTLSFSFEETGHIHLMYVEHVARSGWNVGYWKGSIDFSPEPALLHWPWLVSFSVSEGSDQLSVSSGYTQIYMPDQKAYLWIMGWRRRPI